MSASRSRVIVGLSGGVDSAVAALLLREQGYDVHGLFMSNWDEDDDDSYCTSAADFQDARTVAHELGIPLHRVSFAAEYRQRVFDYFLAEQRAGRTPNPDVLCNREIKFGVMAQYARRLGAAAIATGHYAQLGVGANGAPELRKARDASKDQSYFLAAVEADDFRDVLFPLGELLKSEVREIARRAGLPVAEKKDSTGICFIGERPFAEFLAQYVPPTPGSIVDELGREIGRHEGLAYYTLGQRHGLRVGGVAERAEAPWYVAGKDAERNELLVVQGHDHPLLFDDWLAASDLHWIGTPPEAWTARQPQRCTAKIRYRQPDQPCTVMRGGERELEVSFDQPQRTPTPGQYVVLYDGERCLGGAVIERVGRTTGAAAHTTALRAAG
jgi:tRNA-specific 2-thiouridylase